MKSLHSIFGLLGASEHQSSIWFLPPFKNASKRTPYQYLNNVPDEILKLQIGPLPLVATRMALRF